MLLKVITVAVILIYSVIGIETVTKLKKIDVELAEETKKPLLLRINILVVLTVLLAILTVLNIFLK